MEGFPIFMGITLFLHFLAVDEERSHPLNIFAHCHFKGSSDTSILNILEEPVVRLDFFHLFPQSVGVLLVPSPTTVLNVHDVLSVLVSVLRELNLLISHYNKLFI